MTAIQYRLLEALRVALPMLPVQIRDGAPWIDYKLVRAEYADVLAVNAMLAPHDLTGCEHRVNLREITRRIAPWWTTFAKRPTEAMDGSAVALVPLDPDALFRDACARVVSWLRSEAASSATAAYLGPEAALECATQASPLVRYMLEIPALRTAFDTLGKGGLPSREEASFAHDALRAALDVEVRGTPLEAYDDAQLAIALTDLLYTYAANDLVWRRLAECAANRERAMRETVGRLVPSA